MQWLSWRGRSLSFELPFFPRLWTKHCLVRSWNIYPKLRFSKHQSFGVIIEGLLLVLLTFLPQESSQSNSSRTCDLPTLSGASNSHSKSAMMTRFWYARVQRIQEQLHQYVHIFLFFWPSKSSDMDGDWMEIILRLSSDMFEENVSSEVLVKMKKSVLRGLTKWWFTNPCCWKILILKFISSWQNHLAMGAMILPKRVDLRNLWWFTKWWCWYIWDAHRGWSSTTFWVNWLPLLWSCCWPPFHTSPSLVSPLLNK